MADDDKKTPSPLEETFKHHKEASDRLGSTQTDLTLDQVRIELGNLHLGITRLLGHLINGEVPGPSGVEHKKEQRRELAKARSEHLFEMSRLEERGVIEFAQIGLRALLFANGGALIGMLTFIGNYKMFPSKADSLWLSFGLFVAGLLTALLALFPAWASQAAVSAASEADAQRIFFNAFEDHQKVEAELEAKQSNASKEANFWRWIAVGLALSSAVAFGVGAFFGFRALESTATPPAVLNDASLLSVLERAYDSSKTQTSRADINAAHAVGLLRMDGNTPVLTDAGRDALQRLQAAQRRTVPETKPQQ